MPLRRLVQKEPRKNDATSTVAKSDNGIASPGYRAAITTETGDSDAMQAAVVAWLMIASFGAIAVHYYEVQPYMDEVFHIPQAQQYCGGDFKSWDPMITTLPGLYLFAVATPFACASVSALRACNLLLGAGTVAVFFRLIRRRDPSPCRAAARALALGLYPVHFFFAFLFYTDVGATFWALLALDLALPPGRATDISSYSGHPPTSPGKGDKVTTTTTATRSASEAGPRYVAAAVASGIAILFRQTNTVWAAFAFGVSCLYALERDPGVGPYLCSRSSNSSSTRSAKESGSMSGSGTISGTEDTETEKKGSSDPSSGVASNATNNHGLNSSNTSINHEIEEIIFPGVTRRPCLIAQVWALAKGCLTRAPSLILGSGGQGLLLIPCAIFAAFVVFVNDGHLVVGDHQHHAPSAPHWAQLGYLAFACAMPLVPQLLGHTIDAAVAQAIALEKSNIVSSNARGNSKSSFRRLKVLSGACGAGWEALRVAVITDLRFSLGLLSRQAPTGDASCYKTTSSGVSWRAIFGAVLTWLSLLAVATWGLRVGSPAHPFLLADNRHFSFYLWRRVLGHPDYGPLVRVALAPVYLLCVALLAARLNAEVPQPILRQQQQQLGQQQQQLGQQQLRSALWPVIWFGASAVCLLPSPLMEFRYFTVPLLVAHSRAAPYLLSSHGQVVFGEEDAEEEERQQPNKKNKKKYFNPQENEKLPRRRVAGGWPEGMGAVLCLGVCFLVVDAALLYVFLRKPFTWPDGSVARFMW